MKFLPITFSLLLSTFLVYSQDQNATEEAKSFAANALAGLPFSASQSKSESVLLLDNYIVGAIYDIRGRSYVDFNKGREKMKESDPDSAIYYFGKIIERAGHGIKEDFLLDLAYFNIGMSMFLKDDINGSYAYLQKCSDQEIGKLSLKSAKALIYYSAKDYKKAEKLLLKAIKDDNNKDMAYVTIIDLYEKGLNDGSLADKYQREYVEWQDNKSNADSTGEGRWEDF